MLPLMVFVLLGRAPKNDTSVGEIVEGIAILAVFLAVAYAIGKGGAWFKNRRFDSAWVPLLPVLGDARISSDGGVATTSRLSGTYRGANVHALMTPNVAHKYAPSRNGNVFSVAIENVAGAEDWSIVWNVGLPVVGRSSWVVHPADTPLASRLESAGAVAQIESFGRASVHYLVRDQALEWSAYIEPRVILPPDQFSRVLDALLAMVAINNSANPL